ncbi:MAG: alpha/beta hydrolase [Thermoleophilia bacterium]|nr:alpha/beta hydrolase [Thermoleophilia bacterium]
MTAATVIGTAELLPGFEERWADVRACRMRYFVGGEGPPLVLVHGLSGSATNFTLLGPLLARSRRVLIPELPGHGRSEPLPAAPSLNGYADRVRHVAELEGMLPAPVLGHSLGGAIALRMALRWPEEVSALVLAAAAGIASGTRRAQFWLGLLGRTRPGRRVSPHRARVAGGRALRYAVFGYFGASDPAALADRAVEGLLTGPELHADVLSASRALVREDPREDLHEVGCPCLLLWGARDHQVPIEDAFEYARRLRAPLRTIADCGHLLVAEHPDACADAVERFLDPLGL